LVHSSDQDPGAESFYEETSLTHVLDYGHVLRQGARVEIEMNDGNEVAGNNSGDDLVSFQHVLESDRSVQVEDRVFLAEGIPSSGLSYLFQSVLCFEVACHHWR